MYQFVPHAARQSIRRFRHARAIRRGAFGDRGDPLFSRLSEWVREGSTAIDVGAAVGTYTVALSDLVGATGRVIALEPVHDQFEVLASNICRTQHRNITCLQLAAGEHSGTCNISVPMCHGRPNFYEARVSEDGTPFLLTALDDLPIHGTVSFIKIDAEGQDFAVLRGARRLVEAFHPVVYTEGGNLRVAKWLEYYGYNRVLYQRPSANQVFVAPHHAAPAGLTVIPLAGLDEEAVRRHRSPAGV